MRATTDHLMIDQILTCGSRLHSFLQMCTRKTEPNQYNELLVTSILLFVSSSTNLYWTTNQISIAN